VTAGPDSSIAPRGPRKLSLKGLVFALIAVTLGGAIAAGLAEVACRVFDVRPNRMPYPKFFVYEQGQWVKAHGKRDLRVKTESPYPEVDMGEYVPNTRYRIVYATNPRGYFDGQNSVEIDINSLGLRGPEVTTAKPAGVFRILGLGDSFTHGEGVRDGDTFLRRLEKRLDGAPARDGTKRSVQVLNAGVAGYNTADEVTYLEHRWLDLLDPDLVLITFFLNDAYSDEAFLHAGQEMGLHLAQPEGLAQESYLWDLIQHTIRVRQVSRQISEFYRSHYFSDAHKFLAEGTVTHDIDWDVSRAALGRAAELTSARGKKLVVAVFPELIDLDASYPFRDIHAVVMEACKELGIPAVDLLPAFLGHRARDLWVHETDHHPNEAGHAIAEQAIEQFLTDPRNQLLP